MKEPTRKPKGLQWGMDQELEDQLSIQERLRLQEKLPLEERFTLEQRLLRLLKSENPEPGEGDISMDINNRFINGEEPPHPPPTPPSPPTPESAAETLYPDGPRACLYEDPTTRELIRNKLQELGVTNQHQLIRSHTAADLLEAIQDYERALNDGFRVRYPTAYFRSLLK